MKGEAMTMLNMIAWGLGLDRQKEYFTWTGNFECECCGRVSNKLALCLAMPFVIRLLSFATPYVLTEGIQEMKAMLLSARSKHEFK